MNNLTFRKITFEDLEFLNSVRNLYAPEFLHDSRTFTLEETIQWYNLFNPDYWIILKDGIKIGYIRLSNYSEVNKHITIGADIHPNYTGKGFGKETYYKFMKFLFEKYDLHKISLEVLVTNYKAINLYTKIGFKIEGVKRDEVYKNTRWVDSIIMSIIKKEYDGLERRN